MADKRIDTGVIITDPTTPTQQVGVTSNGSIKTDITHIDGQIPTMDGSGNLQVAPVFANGNFYTEVTNGTNSTGTNIQAVGVLAQFDNTTPTTITENQFGNLRISSNRNLHSTIRDAAGNERGVNVTASNELNVLATAQPSVDIGDVTINNSTGASAVNIQDGGNSITVDQATASSLNAQVVGTVAQDSAASGNPVQASGSHETMADSAPANRVSTDADVNRLSTVDGALYVVPCGPQTWSYHSDGSSALTDATVHSAPGAGLSLYVTDIVCSTGAATALNVFFEEGSTKVLGPYYLEAVAGRGVHIKFQTPKKITANTALTVTTSAAIAQCVDVTGFTAPG